MKVVLKNTNARAAVNPTILCLGTRLYTTLLVLKFASYSFLLSFKFARLNFAHFVETYARSFKFAQVVFCVRCLFFLACLIELLIINAFILSILYQQILRYLSKPNKKVIRWPQKMASKLCNVSRIHDN